MLSLKAINLLGDVSSDTLIGPRELRARKRRFYKRIEPPVREDESFRCVEKVQDACKVSVCFVQIFIRILRGGNL